MAYMQAARKKKPQTLKASWSQTFEEEGKFNFKKSYNALKGL